VKKLLIVLTLFAFVSAFALDIPECFKNHQPPTDWPEVYPKGIAGETIFYPITTDPGPEYFGWDDEDSDFIEMCAIIDTYEIWYSLRIADIEEIMEDFETDTMTRSERGEKLEDLLNLLYDVDVRFMDSGDLCWAKVPPMVQANYVYYMENP